MNMLALMIGPLFAVGATYAEAQIEAAKVLERGEEMPLANQPSPPGTDAGRAAFEWTQIFHDYNLEHEVISLTEQFATSAERARISFAAQTLAAMLRVPAKSSASIQRQHIEVGYLRAGHSINQRHQWAQYLARFPTNESPWLLLQPTIPERMTIYNNGIEHFWLRSDKQWSQHRNSVGIFLVPPFNKFGHISKYIPHDHNDTNKWIRTDTRTDGLVRIIWRSRPRIANREIGVEVFEDHPYRVHRAWWGEINSPNNIEIYSNYVTVSGGIVYPQYSRFLTQIPIDTNMPIALKEELYTVIGTNVAFDQYVDPALFDPVTYPWTQLR